jgi:hypothetical protein
MSPWSMALARRRELNVKLLVERRKPSVTENESPGNDTSCDVP